MSLNYLDWIGTDDLAPLVKFRKDGGPSVEEVFPDFTTVNAAYVKELKRMKSAFQTHIQDETLTRPFLYLILGPPGAGKSYLIEKLIEELKREPSDGGGGGQVKQKPIVFQAANLSEMHGPQELHGLYLNIKRNADNGFFTVTLLDEFDVRWAEGSAMKYLINPVYDGKYWDGHEFQKFGKCAFFFAGSYLQDRDTLMRVHKTLTGVNLGKFLNDLYLASRARHDHAALREIAEIQEYCYTYQKWRAEVDPRTDAIFYLRNLEKIKDFLSRVAGNVIEILDVSQPLAVTQDEFAIESHQGAQPTSKLRFEDVVSYIEQRETEEDSYIHYDHPERAWVEYKNVLLCERLLRVADALRKRFRKHLRGKQLSRVRVERRLLNYLTVTPLINGMRSLEQLVNMLRTPDADVIDWPEPNLVFEPAKIRMAVHNSEKFPDPLRVWELLSKRNPGVHSVIDAHKDRYVSLPL